MKNAIVIIHYNDFESLTSLINNIKEYEIINEIVIVDNNSKETIKEKIRNLKSKKIHIIENKENNGFASAINMGCKYLIDLLNDCNVFISNCDIKIKNENDLKILLSYINKKNVGVVAPVIVEKNGLNRGWKQPSPIHDSLMNIVYFHRFFRNKYMYYEEKKYESNITKVDVVSGCFFLMNTKTLKKINFFDEKTFLYYEENILAKKLSNENLQLVVCNDVFIIHNHSVSIDKNLKKIKKLKIQKKSQYYFQTQYNNANHLEKMFLKSTANFSILLLTIYYFIKDLLKK